MTAQEQDFVALARLLGCEWSLEDREGVVQHLVGTISRIRQLSASLELVDKRITAGVQVAEGE